MSVAALLVEPLHIVRWSAGVDDDFGDVIDVWSEGFEVLGRLEQRGSVERTQDRQILVSDWVLYLLPDVVIHERDRVADQFGRTFEVVGAPAMHSSPQRAFYIEVSLRHVSGA